MKQSEARELLVQMMQMYDSQHDSWLAQPMNGYDMKHLLYLMYHLTCPSSSGSSAGETAVGDVEVE